mmetsp:Transcript_2886/g.6539  ORF Transcript_2886/g.6539 Transcript_2886/m.6539 type:complete len:231 (-) Transcript_2886:502-1194(-)
MPSAAAYAAPKAIPEPLTRMLCCPPSAAGGRGRLRRSSREARHAFEAGSLALSVVLLENAASAQQELTRRDAMPLSMAGGAASGQPEPTRLDVLQVEEGCDAAGRTQRGDDAGEAAAGDVIQAPCHEAGAVAQRDARGAVPRASAPLLRRRASSAAATRASCCRRAALPWAPRHPSASSTPRAPPLTSTPRCRSLCEEGVREAREEESALLDERARLESAVEEADVTAGD